MTYSWIQKLNQSDSRLHKEDVLKQALTVSKLGDTKAQIFLGLLKACYNPYVVFGVKKVDDTVGITDAENPWQEFNTLLTNLSQRKLTGNAARDAIEEISYRFDSNEWNHFLAPVLRRDMRAGISDKTINKVCKNTVYEIPIFGCQLATNCENRPEMKSIKRLEPKLDGVRVLMTVIPGDDQVSVVSYSRNGKVFENFTDIENQIVQHFTALINKTSIAKQLAAGFVFDGEVTGNTFQELMRQARRKENVQANDSVFNIFDIVPLEDFRNGLYRRSLSYRIEILESMRSVIDQMPNVRLLSHIMVDMDTSAGKDQFNRYCKDMVNAGYEGVMIKDIDSPYEAKRNTFWMKYKPVHDYDLTVIGLEEGTGKNAGRLGALVCEGFEDGKHITVNVGSGFTDDDRDNFWSDSSSVIGQTAVVLADAVTQNMDGTYSLRFPRFKTFRTDK